MKKISNPFVFVTRMYSGLFESIQTKEWRPTGIPTIIKLVEGMSKKRPVVWIVSCKNETESAIVHHKVKDILFADFTLRIIPYRVYIPSGKFNLLMNNIFTLYHCMKAMSVTSCKAFYFDRSNIIPAAFLKIFLKVPVIIRILGVYPDQKLLATKPFFKIMNPLSYIAYKKRFDLAVGTQDGSGIEYYLGKLLNPNTPRQILLNGVQKNSLVCETERPEPGRVESGRPLDLLFVGKLIKEKGIIDLIEAVSILKQKKKEFRLTIIGKGDLDEQLYQMVNDRSLAGEVFFAGSIPQDQTYQYYKDADVYISLNKLGNLSNTVLEAMSFGKCIIMLDKDVKRHTDEFTEKFVPKDTAMKINRENIVDNLLKCLEKLYGNRDLVKAYSKKMRLFALENLWSWDQRTEHELDLLKGLIENHK